MSVQPTLAHFLSLPHTERRARTKYKSSGTIPDLKWLQKCPDEILLHILNFLPATTLRQLCSHFHANASHFGRLLSDKSLPHFHQTALNLSQVTNNDNILERLIQLGAHTQTRRLILTNSPSSNSEFILPLTCFQSMNRLCGRTLTSLSLTNGAQSLSSETLNMLPDLFPYLTYLSLSGRVFCQTTSISEPNLTIVKQMKRLRDLNISYFRRLRLINGSNNEEREESRYNSAYKKWDAISSDFLVDLCSCSSLTFVSAIASISAPPPRSNFQYTDGIYETTVQNTTNQPCHIQCS